MKRCAFLLMTFFVTTVPVYSQARQQSRKNGTWYEEALHSLNPNDIDYGSLWEEGKRAILHKMGNPYFEYSFAATAAVVVLLTLVCVQRVSRKRALDLAALSIADILRHDEYSERWRASLLWNSLCQALGTARPFVREADLTKWPNLTGTDLFSASLRRVTTSVMLEA